MYLLKKKVRQALLLSLAFILLNALAIYFDKYLLNLIPIGLLVLAFAFFHLDWLFFILVFLVPLSVQLKYLVPGLSFDLFLPTEPLLAGILILFILKLFNGEKIEKPLLIHPVTLAILFYLAWMAITSVTSTMPLVSFKYLLAHIWFIVSFYFLAVYIFRKRKNMFRFWWMYIVPFAIVIIYTVSRHITFGLNKKTVYFAMKPFYNDHTIYGAALAMFLPVLIGMAVYYYRKGNLLKNIVLWLLTVLYTFGVVFSYTRAAWISLAGALVVFLLIRLFRIRFGVLLGGTVLLAGLFFAFQTQLMIKLEKNKQDSSVDLAKHLQSISNIASDASNRERINRWHSAIRMFREKPVFGFGPGTYMFQYAPYQKWYEETIISTNFGTLGNAHSEYIGPLAESGLAGTLSVLAIMILTFFTGMKVFYAASSFKTKVLVLSSLLGLLTYYIHGLMNNFLDTDKISAPFWGFTAIIVALDIYHKEIMTTGDSGGQVFTDAGQA